MERSDLPEARRIEALLQNISYLKSYWVGEVGNKVILARRGIFTSPRLGEPQTWPGARSLEPYEEDELTEALRPLLPFFKTAPPVPPG